jgi:hypothetical protein
MEDKACLMILIPKAKLVGLDDSSASPCKYRMRKIRDWAYKYASIGHRYLWEKVGAWIRKPVSIWCDHHLPHAVQHISFA